MADESKCECAVTSVEGIKKMAEVFEKTSEDAWAMMVRQQIIDGIFGFLLGTGLFIAAYWCGMKVLKWTKSEKFEWDDGDDGIPAVVAGLICIGVIIAGLVVGLGGIKELLNPQYYAAMELIEDID